MTYTVFIYEERGGDGFLCPNSEILRPASSPVEFPPGIPTFLEDPALGEFFELRR
jgi:hypothetical protein